MEVFRAPLTQGMHDWGLWFGTLLIMGLVVLFVVLLIAFIPGLWR